MRRTLVSLQTCARFYVTRNQRQNRHFFLSFFFFSNFYSSHPFFFVASFDKVPRIYANASAITRITKRKRCIFESIITSRIFLNWNNDGYGNEWNSLLSVFKARYSIRRSESANRIVSREASSRKFINRSSPTLISSRFALE